MSFTVILGDPHLGKSSSLAKYKAGNFGNSRLTDQLNLLDWVLDKALENHADNLIICGDIWEDPKPSPHLIALFISWLKKCQANAINVHIITGNHDIVRSGTITSSSLDIISEMDLEHIYVYKDISTFYIKNTAFTLIPFRDRKYYSTPSNAEALGMLKNSLDYELASIPKNYNKIAVGHLAIEGSIPVGDEIDDLSNELFCPLSMLNDFNFTWMGHVHKPQVMQKTPYIAHIGSMDISNFGETDQKKHIIIYDADSKSFTKETIPTRNLRKISISVPKDTEDATKYIIDQVASMDLDQAIVRMEIVLPQESKSPDKLVLEKKLYSLGAYNIAGISESKKINLIKKEQGSQITSKIDIPSAINKYAEKFIEEKNRDNFISAANEIYAEFKSEVK